MTTFASMQVLTLPSRRFLTCVDFAQSKVVCFMQDNFLIR